MQSVHEHGPSATLPSDVHLESEQLMTESVLLITLFMASQVVLSSDEPVFGGYSNVTKESDTVFVTDEGTYDGRPHSFQVGASCTTETRLRYIALIPCWCSPLRLPLSMPLAKCLCCGGSAHLDYSQRACSSAQPARHAPA